MIIPSRFRFPNPLEQSVSPSSLPRDNSPREGFIIEFWLGKPRFLSIFRKICSQQVRAPKRLQTKLMWWYFIERHVEMFNKGIRYLFHIVLSIWSKRVKLLNITISRQANEAILSQIFFLGIYMYIITCSIITSCFGAFMVHYCFPIMQLPPIFLCVYVFFMFFLIMQSSTLKRRWMTCEFLAKKSSKIFSKNWIQQTQRSELQLFNRFYIMGT